MQTRGSVSRFSPKAVLCIVAAAVIGGSLLFLATTKRPPQQGGITPQSHVFATLEVASMPPGATVVIDGARQQRVTPAAYELGSPGTHRVRLELSGYQPHDDTVVIPPQGGRSSLHIVLRPPVPDWGIAAESTKPAASQPASRSGATGR